MVYDNISVWPYATVSPKLMSQKISGRVNGYILSKSDNFSINEIFQKSSATTCHGEVPLEQSMTPSLALVCLPGDHEYVSCCRDITRIMLKMALSQLIINCLLSTCIMERVNMHAYEVSIVDLGLTPFSIICQSYHVGQSALSHLLLQNVRKCWPSLGSKSQPLDWQAT